jgi:hypothetical protein
MYDGGKMDGADKIPIGCRAGAIGCPPPNPQFQYVNPAAESRHQYGSRMRRPGGRNRGDD